MANDPVAPQAKAPVPVPVPVPAPAPKRPGPPLPPGAIPPGGAPPAGPQVNAQAQPFDDPDDLAVPVSFWQLPWVQNVLPFATSVVVHAGIILIGIVFFLGAQYVAKKVVHKDEVIIPDASMINDGPPGGVQFQGLGADPNRQAFQDKVKDAGTPEGWSDKKGTDIEMKDVGGGAGASDDATIGLSAAGGSYGHGKGGHGSGNGEFTGTGNGTGGPLAMFGTPGGGGIGPKGPVFGHGGNAHKIAFVCDASGSMLVKFSTLRRQLSDTIQGLQAVQSFNIIFFQEQNAVALDPNSLVMATPQNKLKATDFLEDKITPRGTTDPIPGLKVAFAQHPQLLYLLTDGDFPNNDAVLKEIRDLNKDHKVKINTIAFVGANDTDTEFMKLLKQIATENGGVYKFVKESDL